MFRDEQMDQYEGIEINIKSYLEAIVYNSCPLQRVNLSDIQQMNSI